MRSSPEFGPNIPERAYSRFDDYKAMRYLLRLSVRISPVSSEEDTAGQSKYDLDANKLDYVTEEKPQWTDSLITLFEEQSEQGYNYTQISKFFHETVPGTEPESYIEYSVVNDLLYID
ncbi:hypothetical protein GCK72_022558 [Caenorhabditis remanei]|uniref:Uncharacterized protein n=1 Tax=Caenorhabditis remanei TaxID=31234 RepID=A0A6A5FUC5_CAERE|nr:hypothetical protein GCK72_022558 [Caenorhabditis remanei]KAF1746106.1 hypothetical protein GCK72_022558 [Caenorhabditis remanei]